MPDAAAVQLRQIFRAILTEPVAPSSAKPVAANPAPSQTAPPSASAANPSSQTVEISSQSRAELAERLFQTLAFQFQQGARPDNPETASRQLPTPAEWDQALRDPRVSREVRQLLQQPEVAERLARMVEREDLRPAVTELLNRPGLREATSRLLENPQFRQSLEALARQPQAQADVLRVLSASPDSARFVQTFREVLPTLQPAALEVMLQTDSGQRQMEALAKTSSEDARALLTALEQAPPSSQKALQNFFRSRPGQEVLRNGLASAEAMGWVELVRRSAPEQAARLWDAPETARQMEQLWKLPANRPALVETLAAMEGGRLRTFWQGRTDAVREMLQQTLRAPENSRQVEQARQVLESLTRAIQAERGQVASRSASLGRWVGSEDGAALWRQTLSREELRQPTFRLLQESGHLEKVVRQFPETRESMVRLFEGALPKGKPDFSAMQSNWSRFLEGGQSRQALLEMPLNQAGTRALEQTLQDPALREALLQALRQADQMGRNPALGSLRISPEKAALLEQALQSLSELAARRPEVRQTFTALLQSREQTAQLQESLNRLPLQPAPMPATVPESLPAHLKSFLNSLRSTEGGRALWEGLSQTPRESRALLEALQNPETRQTFARLLSRPEGLEQLRTLLTTRNLPPSSDSAQVRLFEQIQSRPELRAALEPLLNRPEPRQAMLRLLQQPDQLRQFQELLRQSDFPKNWDQARQSLDNWRQENIRFLQRSLPPQARQALEGIRQLSNAELSPLTAAPQRETAGKMALLLRHGESARQALEILSQPVNRELTARVFQQEMPQPPWNQWLQRGDLNPRTLTRLLQNPEAARSFLEAAAREGEQPALRQSLKQTHWRQPVLQQLERPEIRLALMRALEGMARSGDGEIRQIPGQMFRSAQLSSQTAQMLTEPETREALVALMATAGQERLSVLAFQSKSSVDRLLQYMMGFSRSAARGTSGSAEPLQMLKNLAQPEAEPVNNRLFSRPEATEWASRLLKMPESAARPSVSSEQAALLRMLGQGGMEKAARQVMENLLGKPGNPNPAARQILEQWTARPESRLALMELAGKPEMQQLARMLAENLGKGQLEQLVARGWQKPEGQQTLAQLLQQPETARAVLEMLALSSREKIPQTLMERPDFQSQMLRLAAEGPKSVQKLLAESGNLRDILGQILSRPENRPQLARLLQNPQTRSMTLQIFQSAPSQSDTAEMEALRWALQRPELSRNLGKAFSAEGNATAMNHSEKMLLLRLFTDPRLADVARRFFETPATRASLAELLQQVGRPASQPVSEAAESLNRLLQMLEQPGMREMARQVFQFENARAALAELLAQPQIGAKNLAGSDAEVILKMLARPEMAEVARDVLSRPEVQQRLPYLLESPATGSRLMEILSRPRMEGALRQMLEAPEMRQAVERYFLEGRGGKETARHLNRPDLARVVLEALSRPEYRNLAPRFFQRPEIPESYFSWLQQPQTRTAALQLAAQPEFARFAAQLFSMDLGQEALARLLPEEGNRELLRLVLQHPGMESPARHLLQSGRSFTPQEQAFLLEVALARMSGQEKARWLQLAGISQTPSTRQADLFQLLQQLNLTGELAKLETRLPTPETLTRELTRLFGPDSQAGMDKGFVEKLSAALEKLGQVSPERGLQAFRSLQALGSLKATNLAETLPKILQLMDQMNGQLAQKGGLPTGLSEPALNRGSTLTLQFGNLPPRQLFATVENLARFGLDFQFIGRDSRGRVQIQLNLAEMPLNTAERSRAPVGRSPLHLHNLSGPERARILQLLPGSVERAGAEGMEEGDNRFFRQVRPSQARQIQALQGTQRQETVTLSRAATDGGALPRMEGAVSFAFLYHLAVIFPWMLPFAPETLEAMAGGGLVAEDGTPLPTLLELLELEPPLLACEPGELMVPGTDEPLIFSPENRP